NQCDLNLDSKETLILEEESQSKMLLKQTDPMILEKKVNIKLVNYAVLNQLSEDFGKRFVPQTELSAEQAFWLKSSVSSEEPSNSSTPVKTNVPKELPKVNIVNTSLMQIKYHLAGFDKVVKERTTPTAITEGTWGFKHTKAVFVNKIIPFIKTLKDTFNNFDQCLLDEITKVQTIFNQMEEVVEQCRLETKSSEIKMKQVLNENNRLLDPIISQDIVNIVMNSSVDINDSVNANVDSLKMCNKCLELEAELIKQHNMSVEITDLNAQLREKVFVITALKNDLRKLKRIDVVDNAAQVSNATAIAPGMYKLDPVTVAHKVKNNRESHIYYLNHIMEQDAILKEIVEQAK
ncbi:hypothetical protein Tco_1498199, partial [Tanacetum coccineum]